MNVSIATLLAEIRQRAVALHQQGALADAKALYRRLLVAFPNDLDLLHLLGVAFYQEEKPYEAARLIARAVNARPDEAVFHSNLSLAFADLGDTPQALQATVTAVVLDPGHPEALVNHGEMLREARHLESAFRFGVRGLRLIPYHAMARCGVGHTLYRLDQYGQSAAYAKQALVLDPGYARALYVKGMSSLTLGLPESEKLLASAAYVKPKNVIFLTAFASAHKFTLDDPWLRRLEEAQSWFDILPLYHQILVLFSLGAAYDNAGEKQRAFDYYLKGNSLQRTRIEYDEPLTLGMFRNIEETFTPELLASREGWGDSSDLPIVIVGLPRSGTTLIEQILASHTQVHGAGELGLFAELLTETDNSSLFPEPVEALQPEQIRTLGQRYAEGLQTKNPAARFVTDKMPGNLPFTGMIHLALPNARIILVRRDPVDVSLSCFSTMFAGGLDYSWDLGEMGRFARASLRLMDHWERLLPADRLLTVRYEDFVADQKNQTRRLLDFCGLDWEEACLAFHKTERAVKTASYSQVRRPIYQSSVRRWRPDEATLKPLTDALSGLDKGLA